MTYQLPVTAAVALNGENSVTLCYYPEGLSGSRRGLSALPVDSVHKCWNCSDDGAVMSPLV